MACAAAAFAPSSPLFASAVSRIALVKPDKARGVEDILLNAAKRGQLGQKVRPTWNKRCYPKGLTPPARSMRVL